MPADPNPYYYPGTTVLRNRLGIDDPVELAQAEDDITAAAIYRLEQDPLPGRFDLDHLRRIHEAVFGDIYPWAGQIRTITIAKDGAPFCPADQITDAAAQLFTRLADENHLAGLDHDRFVDRLTAYHGAINYLHPFPEGNGRTQRAFLGHLARSAGYRIRWDWLDPVINEHAAHQQRVLTTAEPMRLVLAELVEDHRPDATLDAATEADRLRKLAHLVHVDATALQAEADRLRDEAAEGHGPHVVALQERRDRLDRQAHAIRELDDAATGHTHLTPEQASRLALVAGPEPGRTTALLEHEVLTARWDSLRASAQALDKLAADHPADLARRQNARSARILRRADALPNNTPTATAASTIRRLHAARDAAAQHDVAPDPSMPTAPGHHLRTARAFEHHVDTRLAADDGATA